MTNSWPAMVSTQPCGTPGPDEPSVTWLVGEWSITVISEHIDLFLEEFGGIIAGPPAEAALVAEYEHRLPGLVLCFMQEYGFSGFGQGRFFLTDPAVWQASVDMLCEAMEVPRMLGPSMLAP